MFTKIDINELYHIILEGDLFPKLKNLRKLSLSISLKSMDRLEKIFTERNQLYPKLAELNLKISDYSRITLQLSRFFSEHGQIIKKLEIEFVDELKPIIELIIGNCRKLKSLEIWNRNTTTYV